MENRNLYEILVPTIMNDGTPIRTRRHRVWDDTIRKISKGLTIMAVAKGQWVSPNNVLFIERVIPVRIVCTAEEIEEIIKITLKFYKQEAVLAYKISEEVLLRYANES